MQIFSHYCQTIIIRIDWGTETDIMFTMHCFFRAKHDDLEDATKSILNGPSTQNKIERWWRELLDRMERFSKKQLSTLVEGSDCDSFNKQDRWKLLSQMQ